jgi:hypothetical protein
MNAAKPIMLISLFLCTANGFAQDGDKEPVTVLEIGGAPVHATIGSQQKWQGSKFWSGKYDRDVANSMFYKYFTSDSFELKDLATFRPQSLIPKNPWGRV